MQNHNPILLLFHVNNDFLYHKMTQNGRMVSQLVTNTNEISRSENVPNNN